MQRMISAILLTSAIWAVCAEERITYKAGDGVNEVTARVRDDGVVIPERVTTAYVEPPPVDAETQKQLNRIKEGLKDELRVMAKSEKPDAEKVAAYRIHLYRNADGSDVAYVVGVDGVERPVVLIDPAEYKLLTERLEAVWQSFHATVDGRRKLHGKLERTEFDEKARQKVEIYADGYKHKEALHVKRNLPGGKKTRLELKIAEERKKPKGMSEKRWRMRQAFLRRRLGVPKQVTVEHDAVTGKDTVLEGK